MTAVLRRSFPAVAEALAVLLLFLGFLALGAGRPDPEARMLRPHPDLLEQVHMAWALVRGTTPLVTVGNELHPPRYSFAHAVPLALWIRVTGKDPDAPFTWPLAALAGAGAVLIAGLAAWRVPAPWRVAAVALFLLSPITLDAARSALQEPTMVLFLMAGTALWAWSFRTGPGRLERAFCGAAGVCLGLAACIRPTAGALLLGVALYELEAGRRGRGWARPLAGATGAVAAVLVVGALTWIFTGAFRLVAYNHWQPGFRFFAPELAWRPPGNLPDGPPMGVVVQEALLATDPRTRLFLLTPFAMGLLLLAALVAPWFPECPPEDPAAAPPSPAAPPLPSSVFLLAALLEVLAFACYFYHAPRFFLPAWALVIVGGVLGAASLAARLPRLPVVLAHALAAALLLAAESWHWADVLEAWAKRQRPASAVHLAEERYRLIHERHRRVLRRVDGPLFAELPVLQLRLDARLGSFPHPIGRIFLPPDPWYDAHFVHHPQSPAVRTLEDPASWPKDVALLHLQRHGGEPDAAMVERVLRHHREFALYYPAWGDASLQPVLLLLHAMNLRVENRSLTPEWRLMVVSRP